MKTVKGLIIGIILFGQSCSIGDTNFVQIINTPDKFDGKEIEISGIYHEQFEDVAIYLNNNNNREKAIWVDLENSHQDLDGQRIRLKGTFDMSDKGHLGQYIGTIKKAKIIGD